MTRVIRVLVAEDEAPLRDAICDLIATEPGMQVVAAAESATHAIELAEATTPDVAVVDVRMPGGGTEAARGIRKRSPSTSVLALSAYEDQATVLEMLRAGAIGYLVKGISAVEIVDAIRRAARGHASLSVDVMAEVVDDLIRDSTERKRAHDADRKNAAFVAALLEAAPDAAVVVDEDGTIVLVNAQTESQFGYARDELLGEAVETLLPDGLRRNHQAARDVYFADPGTRPTGGDHDTVGVRKDGTAFPVDIFLSAVETEEGPLAAAFVRDASERKRAEERRRNSERRFAALLESTPDAALIVDENGTIVLVNAQTETQFGYGRDELLGQSVETLLPEGIHGRHEAHRDAFLTDPHTRPTAGDPEPVGVRKDGTEFPVDVFLSAIDTEDGPLAAAFVREVTERRRADDLERDLADRRSLLAHLVAAGEQERARIADDIHDDSIQVITAAGMRLQILRRTIEDPEQLKLLGEFEQVIQLSIARLRHLLFELRPPVLDTEGLSAALETYLQSTADERSTYRLEDNLRSQPSPETRTILYRIVQEALVNVRKHAHAKNVTVALEERAGGYHVRVSDDGVGFVLGSTSPLPGHLGLRAMSERAALAGGSLSIEPTPGGGTTVEVWVPRLAASEQRDQHEVWPTPMEGAA